MPLSNCAKCGSVFSRAGKPVCPKCVRKEEADFERAVQWLQEHPGRGIRELSVATGIDERDILKWARENRLALRDMSEFVKCKKCGEPVSVGIFCDRCKIDFSKTVSEELKAMKEGTVAAERSLSPDKGMHYHPEERKKGRVF
jgi:ribosomal protein L32